MCPVSGVSVLGEQLSHRWVNTNYQLLLFLFCIFTCWSNADYSVKNVPFLFAEICLSTDKSVFRSSLGQGSSQTSHEGLNHNQAKAHLFLSNELAFLVAVLGFKTSTKCYVMIRYTTAVCCWIKPFKESVIVKTFVSKEIHWFALRYILEGSIFWITASSLNHVNHLL